MPYFINLAPNYDLTLTPTYFSKQGLFGDVEWRQRTVERRLQHPRDRDRSAGARRFSRLPYGAGDTRLRGSIEIKRQLSSQRQWKFGWNSTLMSDKFFLNDYRLQGINFDNYYFQDVVSSVYLRGQGGPEVFRSQRLSFRGTTANDDNRTLPTAVPGVRLQQVINVPADRSNGIGGELTFDVNVANINQTNAAFQSTGLQTFDTAYHLYNVCETQVGDYLREHVFPGQMLPARHRRQLHARVGASFVAAQLHRSDRRGLEAVRFRPPRRRGDRAQRNRIDHLRQRVRREHRRQFEPGRVFLRLEPRRFARACPAPGSNTAIRSFPRRPGARRRSRRSPSSSSGRTRSSPECSPTKIRRASFSTTRTCSPGTSSPDTIGSRAARGSTTEIQYTADFANGGHANLVGGESIQVAGQNSYTLYDPANTGLESGLDKKYLELRVRRDAAPTSNPITFISKQQFDSSTLQLARFDGIAKANYQRRQRQRRLRALRRPAGARIGVSRAKASPGISPTSSWIAGRSTARSCSTCRAIITTCWARHAALLSRRIFARDRLQGRMHDAHHQVFVQCQPARRLQRISRRAGHL